MKSKCGGNALFKLRKFIKATSTVVSFVATGKVDLKTSMHVGDHAPDEENLCGQYFLKYLTCTSSFAPSTFSHYNHNSPPYTYIAGSDSMHRIDHIGLPIK